MFHLVDPSTQCLVQTAEVSLQSSVKGQPDQQNHNPCEASHTQVPPEKHRISCHLKDTSAGYRSFVAQWWNMLVRLGSFIFIFLTSGLYKKRGRGKKKTCLGLQDQENLTESRKIRYHPRVYEANTSSPPLSPYRPAWASPGVRWHLHRASANSSRRCRLEAWSAHGWPSSWSGRRTDRGCSKTDFFLPFITKITINLHGHDFVGIHGDFGDEGQKILGIQRWWIGGEISMGVAPWPPNLLF